MKLQNFLSTKAKCIKEFDPRYFNSWDVGETYDISITIQVTDKNNDDICFEPQDFLDHFEPVLDSAENPLQNIELTPEFEAVEPVLADNSVNIQDIKDAHKFRVGDKVYWGLKSRIFKVYRLVTTNVLQVELDDCVADVHKDELCSATQENYGKLCSLFECIDFEQPLKELKGSDLCRAMLDKGWVSVPCYISDESDYEADNNAFCALIGKFDKCFKELATNYEHEYAVPFDPRTGEPLTEAVLDE